MSSSAPRNTLTSPLGNLTLDELRDEIAAGRIDTVVAGVVDSQGRVLGKRSPANYFVKSASQKFSLGEALLNCDLEQHFSQGFRSCNFDTGFGNCIIKPDLRTLRRMPWTGTGDSTAIVLSDMYSMTSRKELAHSPRAILKKQLARLEERGLAAMFASEMEFYLFDENHKSAATKRWQSLSTASAYHQIYAIGATAREEKVMAKIRKSAEAAGIDLEATIGEYGLGQEELNLVYCNALEMADRHALLKLACHEIAESEGWCCTFMAKYSNEQYGSACHIHNSLCLLADGRPAFPDSADKRFGMSKLMRGWMAGQMKYAREYVYFLAPYVNSYKRLAPNSFAPTKICWAPENRTTSFRVCGIGEAGGDGSSLRGECRIGGADLNPYLAFAALIAAGLAGVDEELELPEPCTGNAYENDELEEVPRTLRHATDTLEASTMLRKALGDDVVEHYVHHGRFEQSEFDKRITDWELQRGFDRA